MDQGKKYTAFLSFAKPDRPLVLALHRLFEELGEDTYFAPENIPKSGTPEWRKEIVRGINDSYCFIPIYTRYSLDRPWVLYESGVADSLGLARYPARVSGISYGELYDLPGPDVIVYDLFDLESLTQLVINACLRSSNIRRGPLEKRVRPLIKGSSYASEVISFAKARWVFIAGNIPRDNFWTSSVAVNYNSTSEYEDRLKHFLEKLTTALLGVGFNLASCPQVKPVGGVIARAATTWLLDNSPSDVHERFKYGGIYPVDRGTRESDLRADAREHLLKFLLDFRKSYLHDVEWLVIIGGSEGTIEEYQVARELKGVKTFAIPCFGGAAYQIWNNQDRKYKGPCNCPQKKGDCDPSGIAKYLKEKKFL